MTHIQYINCDKWKKVIGISLWIGATIALGSCIYYLLNNTTFQIQDLHASCFISTHNNKPFNTCIDDNGDLLGLIWFVALFVNSINYFMIYRSLNKHYQWIEFRCGVKPGNGDSN